MKRKGFFWMGLVAVLLVAGAAMFSGARHAAPPEPPVHSLPALPDTVRSSEDSLPVTLYGVDLSGYRVEQMYVGRNQTLADLLLPAGISMQKVVEISSLPDSLINERRIKMGNRYSLFFRPDSVVDFFVYEKDALTYVLVDLRGGSIAARQGMKPVIRQWKTAAGTIESSLWLAMKEQETNPLLAVELSEIFAWSIDFFGIQPGDQYKVIYEESYVDSVSVGIDRVLGAWFSHNGADFWGIPFMQDGVRSFYDEEGNSLRKAFLKAPLRYSRISSGFSNSRFHPVLKIRRPHHGVDYAAPAGTPVQTVGDGVVTKIGYQANGGGNYVSIKHNSVYSTTYMHLKGFASGLRQGQYVKQGDVIGYVGSSGLATGPHLDFRFYKNGSAVNPLRVEAPPVEPVGDSLRVFFDVKRTLVMQALRWV
ncbi:MAG: peptidoglycan DD-metalloendopeptidase family protein [Bacteroidales bacterium]